MANSATQAMSNLDIFTAIQSEPINVEEWLTRAENDRYGATTMFLGTVRDHDPETGDLRVVGIEYSAHPGATEVLRNEMADLLAEVVGPQPEAPVSVIAIHRIGEIAVGEAAMLVIVCGAHRYPSMDLVPQIVERIKQTLPMWKKQLLADGSSAWSNLP